MVYATVHEHRRRGRVVGVSVERIYGSAEQFTTGFNICPSVRFMLTGPSMSAADEPVRLIELAKRTVLSDRKIKDIVMIEGVDWTDPREVMVRYSVLAVGEDRGSARDDVLRIPLPKE